MGKNANDDVFCSLLMRMVASSDGDNRRASGGTTKLAGVQYVRYSMDMIVKILKGGALVARKSPPNVMFFLTIMMSF